MALMDDIKKSLQSGFKLPQFGQSERLEKLQRASTGRLVSETGPAATSLAEQVAASAAEKQRQEDVLAGQVAAEELTMQEKAQQEQFRQQSKELDERVLNAKQDMQNKVDNILQEYGQRVGELDMREESAKTQYAITMMRLSNDDYLDRLETEAASARLQDSAAFEWELTQSVFRDEIELLKGDLSFRSALAATEREFKEYLAEIDIEQAIQLAAADLATSEKLAQYQAIGEGVTSLGRAGALAAGSLLEGGEELGGGSATASTGTSGSQGSMNFPGSKRTIF